MKMVKGLLLGSAAGIVALSGAQAADLPVKARAVEYVKVCSIYGAGFYYIPGTDTCLKVGGYVRMDWGVNAGGSHSPYVNGQGGANNRLTAGYETRVRAIMSWDARTQTEWGTLRAYARAGWEQNSGDPNYRGICYFDRAFIQFAGLTVGKTQSFFGFYSNANNYSTLQGGGHSDAGLNLTAYTFQWAGGFSATISVEDNTHHRGGIYDATPGGSALLIGALPIGPGLQGYGDYTGPHIPDIVGNIRVDQPWGSAQIAAAYHEVRGAFRGANVNTNPNGPTGDGFAVTGGVKFNLPWAQGDELWIQGTWTRGATQYLGLNPFVHTGGQFAMYRGGIPVNLGGNGSAGLAWTFDGAFDGAGGMALVEGWSVLVSLQHYWTPSLRTSVFGHYTDLDFGGNAVAGRSRTVSDKICNGPGAAAGVQAIVAGNCNFDYRIWQIGSRTIWSPVRNLDIGVEVLYTKLDQSFNGQALLAAFNGRAAGVYNLRDQDVVSGTLRFQRNFWP